MYVFVDESGTNKSSGVCVFAAILVETEQLDPLNDLVVAAEAKAKVKSFHWSKAPWPVRETFLKAVVKGDFVVRYQLSKNPLRDFGVALESTLITAAEGVDVQRIILDGRKDKSYERRLKKVLRDKGLSSKRLRTADDEAYPMLRVADAVAGVLGAHANKPSDKTKVLMKAMSKRLQ
ncbi:MAG TPA: DUF3800 domain-containing protein [Candidatus Saccharimonadia bacterium]|jgi:hypothetical protein